MQKECLLVAGSNRLPVSSASSTHCSVCWTDGTSALAIVVAADPDQQFVLVVAAETGQRGRHGGLALADLGPGLGHVALLEERPERDHEVEVGSPERHAGSALLVVAVGVAVAGISWSSMNGQVVTVFLLDCNLSSTSQNDRKMPIDLAAARPGVNLPTWPKTPRSTSTCCSRWARCLRTGT
jgi:hypothetical protein